MPNSYIVVLPIFICMLDDVKCVPIWQRCIRCSGAKLPQLIVWDFSKVLSAATAPPLRLCVCFNKHTRSLHTLFINLIVLILSASDNGDI